MLGIQLKDDSRLQVFKIIVVTGKVPQVDNLIIRDNGSFQGGIQADYIKFVIMQFPYIHICTILSDDRINDPVVKPSIRKEV